MKLYTGARFLTCEAENRVCAQMAVDAGRIAWIGDEADCPAEFARAERVDLGGGAVTPAFGDTHIHFESLSIFENTFYLTNASDFEAAGEIVRAYARSHPRAAVLLGYGVSAHTLREGRLPGRADMDRWTDRPLMVVKYDGHAAVCNSAMLSLLSETVRRDPGCREDTGWLYQNAFFLGVNEVTGRIPVLDIVRSLTRGARALAEVGVGLVHNVEGVGFKNDLDVDMFNFLAPGLAQDYRTFFQTMDVEAAKRRGMRRIGGCFKLALDGCFGSEDAALTRPYANDPSNRGVLYYTQDQVNDFAIRANRAGMQIAMHAIGDAAVEQCVTAYEAALGDCPRADHRHIIIHCCLASDEQLDRIAALGLSVAAQSPFIYWPEEPDAYLRAILGEERAARLNPIGSMLRRGILVGDGSDGPTTRPSPLRAMSFAVSHPNPEERATRLEALRMITCNPARMTFDEGELGALKPGLRANFVHLSDDPLTAGSIAQIQVRALYLRGRRVTPQAPGAIALVARALARRLQQKRKNL